MSETIILDYLFILNLDSDLDLSATARRHAIGSSNATVRITGHHMTLANFKIQSNCPFNRVSVLSGFL